VHVLVIEYALFSSGHRLPFFLSLGEK
jgi:hypothetical protein